MGDAASQRPDGAPLLVMEAVSRRFAGIRAVDGVSLAIPHGATLAVVGESGSGKSTLARLAAGLLTPDSGRVTLHATRVGMVFQDPSGSLDPRWTVGDSIAEPVRAYALRQGAAAIAARVTDLLASVGLPASAATRRPRGFSLGQVQRIAIARALAGEPAFLVCDEPTSALDVSVQAQVLNLLRDVQARLGLSMLLVSHDLGVVRFMADRVAVMLRGRLIEHGPADAVFGAPRHPYTRLLRDAVPAIAAPRAAVTAPVETLAGGRGDGCVFRRRCPHAIGRCAREVPALRTVDGISVACHAVAERW